MMNQMDGIQVANSSMVPLRIDLMNKCRDLERKEDTNIVGLHLLQI